MPTKTGKTYSSFYKNDLAINQSSNTGADGVVRTIQDGIGNNTALSLSTRNVSITNTTHNTTSAFVVTNKDGSNILAVDTTNSKILGGASQTALNTNYAYFGIDNTGSTAQTADTHIAIPFQNANAGATFLAVGSSTSSSFNDTNPSATIVTTIGAYVLTQLYWHVVDDITIDAVTWFHGADAATGDSTAAHLMSYDIDTANGSTGGDLSDGTVVADGATITNAGYEQVYYQAMTVQSANVDAGRVILFTFAADTINSDYSINATVKYHIR